MNPTNEVAVVDKAACAINAHLDEGKELAAQQKRGWTSP